MFHFGGGKHFDVAWSDVNTDTSTKYLLCFRFGTYSVPNFGSPYGHLTETPYGVPKVLTVRSTDPYGFGTCVVRQKKSGNRTGETPPAFKFGRTYVRYSITRSDPPIVLWARGA